MLVQLLRSGRHECEGALIRTLRVENQFGAEISLVIALDSPPDIATSRFVDHLKGKSPLTGAQRLTAFVIGKGSEIWRRYRVPDGVRIILTELDRVPGPIARRQGSDKSVDTGLRRAGRFAGLAALLPIKPRARERSPSLPRVAFSVTSPDAT